MERNRIMMTNKDPRFDIFFFGISDNTDLMEWLCLLRFQKIPKQIKAKENIPTTKLALVMRKGVRPKIMDKKSIMAILDPNDKTKSSKLENFLYIPLAKSRNAPGINKTKK